MSGSSARLCGNRFRLYAERRRSCENMSRFRGWSRRLCVNSSHLCGSATRSCDSDPKLRVRLACLRGNARAWMARARVYAGTIHSWEARTYASSAASSGSLKSACALPAISRASVARTRVRWARLEDYELCGQGSSW